MGAYVPHSNAQRIRPNKADDGCKSRDGGDKKHGVLRESQRSGRSIARPAAECEAIDIDGEEHHHKHYRRTVKSQAHASEAKILCRRRPPSQQAPNEQTMGPFADGTHVHFVCQNGKVTAWWIDHNDGTETAPPH